MSGRIAQRAIDAVRERADLVELVEARMGPGRRSRGQVMARCPFHDERTPSFHIEPLEKTFFCFGCGENGDLFTYVERIENLSFPDAVEWLADRYGIELEYEESSAAERQQRDQGRRGEALLDEVAAFYERYLAQAAEAEPARRYLSERGISPDTTKLFRLGFSPTGWDRVAQAALTKGYSVTELYQAGVCRAGRRGPVDLFRGRIIFPLCDARGRVRGFGGRVMPGQEGPKYLNSPESSLFRKSAILYGLHLARAAITRAQRAIVVEGYTDVILAQQAGIADVVASMGTALTEEQVRELRRVATEVVLCFDADAAGQKAAQRGMDIAVRAGLSVRVVALPPGSDPADLARQPEALAAVVGEAQSVLAFRVGRALEFAASRGADAAYAAAREALAAASPGPERDEQQRRVAGALRLRADTEAALVPRRGARPATGPVRAARRDQRTELEFDLVGALLADPGAGRELLRRDELANLRDPQLRQLLPWVLGRLEGATTPPPHELAGVAASVLARSGQMAEPQSALRNLYVGVRLATVEDQIAVLKEKLRADDYTHEDLAALTGLERQRATLRDRLLRDQDTSHA